MSVDDGPMSSPNLVQFGNAELSREVPPPLKLNGKNVNKQTDGINHQTC